MLSIAICDDEEYFRITEKQLILKYMAGKNCECMIDMYESGKELLNLVERTSNNLYREELSKEFKLFSSQTKLYYTPLLNDESAFIPSSFIEIP